MFSITLKLMRKSLKMLVPAGIAILIGTTFIASTFLFSNAMDDSMRAQALAQYGRANYVTVVDSSESLDGEESTEVGDTTVADFNLDRLRATDGVDGVRVGNQLTVEVSNADKHATVLVGATNADAKLLPVEVTEGAAPSDNGEIALPEDAASRLGVNVGDNVELTVADGGEGNGTAGTDGADDTADATEPQTAQLTVRLTGLTRDSAQAWGYYGGMGLLSDAELARVSGAADFASMIVNGLTLDLETGRAEATAEAVKGMLPKHWTLATTSQMADEWMKRMGSGQMSATTIFLLGFGAVAMLVAALVIANTFQVLVAQRRRTLALLRTIGAKKGQLYRSVVLEALVLGAVASLCGVGAGIGLMALVTRTDLLASMGLSARLIITWPVIVVPLAFGVVVTVLACLSSARSATAVTPLEALRPLELSEQARRAGRVRAIVGVLVIALGLGLTIWALLWMNTAVSVSTSNPGVMNDYGNVLLTAIGGCALIFIGVVVTAVFWMPLLMKGIGWLVSHCGPSCVLAHANIQKNPRRVAATGAALLIGVTLVTAIATGASSAKTTMGQSLDSRYSVDVAVSAANLDDATVSKVKAVEGVSHVFDAPQATGWALGSSGNMYSVTFIGIKDIDSLKPVMNADLSGTVVGSGTALMPEISSYTGAKLKFGDASAVEFGTGSPYDADGETMKGEFTLKITQADYRRVDGSTEAAAFVPESMFTDGTLTADGRILLLDVNVDGTGRTVNEVMNDVQGAVSSLSGVSVTGPIADRVSWEQIIDSLMMLMVALLAVAVLIALVGVANTLSLSVIERTRESATLRAIGMTRGQLRRSLAVEALLISVVSGVAGIVLGTLFGWAGSAMVFSLYGKVVYPVEWGTAGVVLAVAAVSALLASVLPARRAVKTPPVEALAEA